MSAESQALRDEILYRQVKGNRSLYLTLSIVLACATLVAVAFAVGIIALNKGMKAFSTMIVMGIGLGISATVYWQQSKRYAKALEEIGENATGIDTCRTYSQETAKIIAGSRRSKDVLRQLWIAYGIMAVMMVGFGVLFLVLIVLMPDDVTIFLISGSVMWIGGVLLSILTVRTFREWLMARRLEELEK